MEQVITVSQINTYIKFLIEEAEVLGRVYVTGEISNLSDHYRSGHIYLSLKDEKSIIKAVMFAQSAKRLRFAPKDGMKVLVRGKITVYEPTGQYQLYIEDMQPDGLGALNLAYEQLKEKLEAEGLFSKEHKRPLPLYPKAIAVITSPTGAAVQDIFRILARRWPLARVLFSPCTVQGEKAVPQLLESIAAVSQHAEADLIIIGRGGGSIEDLWAFNSEALARAIYAAPVPVISAVGHETDFTICDFVADLRASTPSAAAELSVPDIDEEMERLQALQGRIQALIEQKLLYATMRLDSLKAPETLLQQLLVRKKTDIATLNQELRILTADRLSRTKSTLEGLAGRLDAMSPLKVLSRGYSLLTGTKNSTITSVGQVCVGDAIRARLEDGTLALRVEQIEQ